MLLEIRAWLRSYWLLLLTAGLYLVQATGYAVGVLLPYVDADQFVMADMTSFYAAGIVPEPYFWGQNYLFPLESWLGVPLVALGARADLALSYISLVLFYIPYLVATALCVKNKNIISAFLVALLPLTLPPEYLISAMIPRNFGTTAALAAAAAIVIVRPIKYQLVLALAGALLGVCFASNPATIVLFPALIFGIRKNTWVSWSSGLIAGAATIYGLGLFYFLHPEAIHYFPEPLSFSLRELKQSLTSPEIFIPPLTLLACSFALLTWSVWRSRNRSSKKYVIAAALTMLIVLVYFGTGRISSYTSSPFYSSYRFWTALPLLVVVLAVADVKAWMRPTWLNSALATAVISTGLVLAAGASLMVLSSQRASLLAQPTPSDLALRTSVQADCLQLSQQMSTATQYVELSRPNSWLTYACFSLNGAIVTNVEQDRRTWLPVLIEQQGLSKISR